MDKKKLIEHIRVELEKDLEVMTASQKATVEGMTSEESKPENEYDTRGLEASYLARGQAKRINEIRELLLLLKHIEIKSFTADDEISATALVEVESAGKTSLLLMMPQGGGVTVTFEGKRIQIVTPNSPLGEALVGQKEGDIAVVEQGPQVREYEILSIS
mgnify:CR=1 FL=1